LVAALLLRTIDLMQLPAGIHGDEAVVGAEAQRILREGSIGPYSRHAGGQPTVPIYVSALAMKLFGETIETLRLVSATAGVLTVLALWMVLRRNLRPGTAITAAALLAVLPWHVHFSRIAYPLIFWPLLAVLLAGALAEALRSGAWRWWAVTGALTGGGIYVYNAHPLLVAVTGMVIAVSLLVVERERIPTLRRHAVGLLVCALCALLVILPMVRYATSDNARYGKHFDDVSTFEREEWHALDSPPEQVRYIGTAYVSYWSGLTSERKPDGVDGTGLTPIVPLGVLLLAAAGLGIALRTLRTPLVWFGVVALLVMPAATFMTEGGLARRTFIVAPLLAMFAAMALMRLYAFLRRATRPAPALVAVALVSSLIGYQSVTLYFKEFAAPEVQQRVMARPMADSVRFISGLPDDSYVYFYSNQWSFNHVTRKFIAPDAQGEDRSKQFGTYQFWVNPSRGTPVIMLLGHYKPDLARIRGLYPNGEIIAGGAGQNAPFIAYRINGFTTAGTAPGGRLTAE
jgi:4-amino-4-deoxy-L-arabinose transferase-like glycosyltransferase